MKQPLRVGLLLDSVSMTAWSCRMVEKIMAGSYATVSLAILNDNDGAGRRISRFEAIRTKFSYFLYDLYVRYDTRRFRPHPDAFETKDARELLRDVPVLKVKTRLQGHSHFFSDSDIGKIREHRLDVIVRLGFGILRGGILNASKYGVWSYHHGDNRVNRGGPAGFWEIVERHPVTGSVLQILSEELDNGTVIYRSYSSTHRLSLRVNKNIFYWKTLEFVPRKLKELYEDGEEVFFARAKELNPAPYFYTRRLYSPRHATNIVMLGLIFRQALLYLKDLITDKFFNEQWFLFFSLGRGLSTSLSRFKKILPPGDRFWADPHCIHKDGKYYIFLEEYLFRTRKGHIALLEMDGQGNYKTPVPVLERPYHLSYPFVFEHEGVWYMIPESRSNRTIELYRCAAFPGKWEFVKNIMAGVDAVDATLFRRGNIWWLFASMLTNRGASSSDELFLFYADSPLADTWKPHRLNPVVSDVTRARPAGRLFEFNGKLCRPSQDCSRGYGSAVVLNEVTVLGENEYRETEVCRITPEWDERVKGMHTLNHAGDLTLFDGKHFTGKFSFPRMPVMRPFQAKNAGAGVAVTEKLAPAVLTSGN